MTDQLNNGRVDINLVVERLNRGLSIRTAALAIGVARDTLAAAERGDSLNPASAKKIADFYGVRVTDIVDLESAA